MREKRALLSFYTMIFLIWGMLLTVFPNQVFGDSFIVKEGKPNAEIVISEKPARMTKLAAEELRDYIRKISGAELQITSKPGMEFPIKIYVGKSEHTDPQNINTDGLDYGAFRMVSDQNRLSENAELQKLRHCFIMTYDLRNREKVSSRTTC